jgi:hypothetical protein
MVAEGRRVALGQVALDDAALLEPTNTLKHCGRCQTNATADLRIGNASIRLQDAKNREVGAVDHTMRIRFVRVSFQRNLQITNAALQHMQRTNLRRIPLLYSAWRALKLSRAGQAVAGRIAARIGPRRLKLLEQNALLPDPSYAREWPHVKALLARTGLLEQRGFAVDIAAGDGVTSSCTLPLFRDYGWSGLAVECDDARFTLLQHIYARFPRVRTESLRVTPDNVRATLRDVAMRPAFVNIDIDSFDLAIAVEIAEALQPAIIDIEINEKVPPPIRYATLYSPAFDFTPDHFYGCSINAAFDVLSVRGYVLEAVEYNNAFFVRADFAAQHGIRGTDPETAYAQGYAQRADRLEYFPWNRDMEALQTLAPAQGLEFLARKFGQRTPYRLQLERLT